MEPNFDIWSGCVLFIFTVFSPYAAPYEQIVAWNDREMRKKASRRSLQRIVGWKDSEESVFATDWMHLTSDA